MVEQKKLEIADIVGANGRYQLLALGVAVYVNAFLGTLHIFVELLAPEVDLYWNWEESDPNRTIFKSTDCRFAELQNYRELHNYSQDTSKLIYKSQYSDNTLTEQFQLICERSWMTSLANSLSFWGTLIGSFLSGILSERFGRRPVMLHLFVLALGANICILFQKNLVLFLAGCFVYGATVIPLNQALVIEALEIFPTSRRAAYSTLSRYGAMIGQILLVGVLWITRDWFYTQLAQTVFAATSFLLAFYVLESPLWLVVRGRDEEAKCNLLKIAERNRLDLTEVEPKIDLWLHQMNVESTTRGKTEKGNFLELFKNSVIIRYILCITFVRISCLFIYFGITMNVQSFGANLYEEITISSALSICAGFATILLLSTFSIRIITMSFLLALVVSCILYTVTYEYTMARTVLSLVSRMLITSPFNTIFVYLTEVFPTSVRVIGTSTTVMFSSFITPVAPFTKELGERTAPYVPFALFAALSLLSVFILKFLPETKGRPLKQTVEELKE